jgi:AcrR family transcriptional regulator
MVQDPVARFPATRRTLAKQQTRRRLIAAAKALVAERGYEAATLRDVAAMAQLSTGAVFANFDDKADLFTAVIADDLADLFAQMKRIAAEHARPGDALVNMLAAGYALNAGRRALVQAQLAFSWSNGLGMEQRGCAGVGMILALLAEILREGVRSGDLLPSIDAVLIAEMAWDSYVANYRRAIFDGWALDTLRARLARQIDILLDGYRGAERGDSPNWRISGRAVEAAPRSAVRG